MQVFLGWDLLLPHTAGQIVATDDGCGVWGWPMTIWPASVAIISQNFVSL